MIARLAAEKMKYNYKHNAVGIWWYMVGPCFSQFAQYTSMVGPRGRPHFSQNPFFCSVYQYGRTARSTSFFSKPVFLLSMA